MENNTETPKERTKALTVQIPESVLKAFKELHASDTWTQAELMQQLIERYYEPIKQKETDAKQIAEYKDVLAEMERANADLENQIAELTTMLEQKNAEFTELQNNSQSNSEREAELQQAIDDRDAQIAELTARVADIDHIIQNSEKYEIEPLNVKLLNFVAEREGKRRNQQWTASDVINFFVHCRFEKGQLNGDLKSVPDDVVRKFKEELGLIQQKKSTLTI